MDKKQGLELLPDVIGDEARAKVDWRKTLANEPDEDDDEERPADGLLKGVLGFDPDDLF